MTDHDPTREAPTSPHVLPRQTTPTWEMELLISGLTVFALLQLPGVLDDWFQRAFVRMELEYGTMTMLLYIYVKSAVLGLSITFILHLAFRGYWVALIGMRSVYPLGIRWDRLRMGRQFRAVSRNLEEPMDTLIERADNRATTVFAVGVGLALVMITPILLVTVVFVFTLALTTLVDTGLPWMTAFGIANLIVLGPFLFAVTLDRVLGERLRDDATLTRALRAVMRVYAVFGMGRTSNPLLAVFQSHLGAKRGALFMGLAMFVMFGIVFGQMMSDWGAVRLDTFRWLPRDQSGSVRTLRPEHYATMRVAQTLRSLLPYIQSDIIKDPYLRVFVPYDAGRHNPAFARQCNGIDRASLDDQTAEAQRRAALLACLARLQPLTLDGAPIAVEYDFASSPSGTERGFVAMVPVRDLARGRHELTVGRIVREDSKSDRARGDAPYRIPFWR